MKSHTVEREVCTSLLKDINFNVVELLQKFDVLASIVRKQKESRLDPLGRAIFSEFNSKKFSVQVNPKRKQSCRK